MSSHRFPRPLATMPFAAISLFLAYSGQALATEPAQTAVEIHAGSISERNLAGKSTDVYSISLAAGECARIAVEQKGVDVLVRVLDPEGKTVAEMDDALTLEGTERLTVAADTTSTWQVTVRARYPRIADGRYRLAVEAVGPSTEKDRQFFEAVRSVTTALSLSGRGKMEESRSAAAHAVDLGVKALGADDPYVGFLTTRLANCERLLGHFPAALEGYEHAAKIYEAAVGRQDQRTVIALEGVALTSIAQNDYARAEALEKEALASTVNVLGPGHPRVASRLINLAIVHQDLADKQGAIADLERALEICEKTFDPEEFQYIAVVNNLGTLYRELGDYDRAVPLLRRSLQMVEKKFGAQHPFVATPLQELGIVAREQKDYDEALATLWRAEAARETAYGLSHRDTVSTLMVIANVFAAKGDFNAALDLQQWILDVVEGAMGPYHQLTLLALANLARTYDALGNAPCALEYEARMDSVLEKNLELNLAIGSERQKLAYAESMSGRTDRTISLQLAKAPHDESAAEHALLVLLQRKARVLDAMSENLQTVRERSDAHGRALLDDLRTKTGELAKLALDGSGKSGSDERRAQLGSLEKEKEQLEATISQQSARFRAAHSPVTLETVRAAIPKNAALVEFSVYRPFDARAVADDEEFGEARYVAYVVRRQGPVTWVDLGLARGIDAAIARWREALRDPADAAVDRLGRQLGRKVADPLQKLVRGASRLLISPDGQLGLIPFEALVDARGRHLVDTYSISYLTTGRDLIRMNVPAPRGGPPVLVADPFFGEPNASVVKLASLRAPLRSITSGEDLSTVYFAPLAGTREEARGIKSLFPEAHLLTGKEASKSALQHLGAPRILHIATHGFFLDSTTSGAKEKPARGTRAVSAKVGTTNPLLRSGLALSGANLSGRGDDDGVLTALEAANLDLWGTKLVTLSACDSGVGEVKNREGVYGLRRAFFLAGAETVVMSLWPISDYVTRQMMTAYYGGLREGLGRGDALRRAQLAMKQRKGRAHPFYWASFIESGDWRPLGK